MTNNVEEKKDCSLSVSIIIPARKKDYLLDECLENINKLYKNIKIFVVLDEFCEEDYLEYDNVCVLKSQNKTMSAKRNLGVSVCKTKYIAFIDSDAYPNEKWLENAIDFLEKNENYSAVTGNQVLPKNDNLIKKCLRQIRFCRIFTYPEWCKVIDKNAKEQDCSEFMTSNVIMRCDDYKSIGGMNEQFYLAEDNEFSSRLIANGYKIRFVPKVSVFHHECSFFPFMRKICCMAYSYSGEFVSLKNKTIKEGFCVFFPLMATCMWLLTVCAGTFLKQNVSFLFIFPVLIALLFMTEAYKLAKNIEEKQLLCWFLLIFSCISFCFVWVLGTFCGFLHIKIIEVSKAYKHY